MRLEVGAGDLALPLAVVELDVHVHDLEAAVAGTRSRCPFVFAVVDANWLKTNKEKFTKGIQIPENEFLIHPNTRFLVSNFQMFLVLSYNENLTELFNI